MGMYNFSSSIVSYFSLIASLGIATYGVREGAQYRNQSQEITQFISEIFSINIISTVCSYILLSTLVTCVPFFRDYRSIILLLSLEIIFTTMGVSWTCNLYEDFLFIAIRTIAVQIVSLILIFIFVQSQEDLLKYTVIMILSNSGANLLNFFYVRKNYCNFKLTLKINWRKHLKPILLIFSTSVAVTIYVSSDTTMLGFMTSNYQVGLYGTAVKIYTIIKNFLAAILIVLIPRFSLLMSTDKYIEVKSLFEDVFNVLSIVMLPMAIGVFMLSDDIVCLIAGKDFIAAATPLRLLSISVIFALYSYILTQCILIPAKKEKLVFKTTVFSASSNVLLNFILIPIGGINATAITTIIAELITMSVSSYSVKKHFNLNLKLYDLGSVILGCVLIAIVCFGSRNIENLYTRLLVSVILSIATYLMVLIACRNRTLYRLAKLL